MDSLPQDILYNIFIRLPLIQKQECMLVSKLWKQVIITRCLFHTIICSQAVPDGLLVRFGEQVDEFKLKINIITASNIMPLLYSVPNLRRIEMKTYESDFTITDIRPESIPMRIESIKERGACEMTRTLGAASLCPRLVTLDLDIMISSWSFKSKAIWNICESLKDMPLLRHLTMRNSFLSLNHCEMIHANAPRLSLLDVQITCDKSLGIHEIKPATTITTLSLEVNDFCRAAQKTLFGYISQKYPKLQHFRLYDLSMVFDAKDNVEDEVFKMNLPVLIKNLSAPLTSLELEGIDLNPSFFQLLDSLHYKLLKCTLSPFNERTAHALAQSQQSQYIEELCVTIVYNASFVWLTHFKNLKSLTIDYDQDDTIVYGPSLFASCPATLESIKIGENFPVLLAKKCNHPLPSIKKLQSSAVNIWREDYGFLSRFFPNLTWLSLMIDEEEEEEEEEMTRLDFSRHHFEYCELKTMRTRPYSVMVITDNKTAHYSPYYKNRTMGYLDDYIPSIPKERVSSPVVIEFICASVKELVIDDCHASLF